MYKIIYISAWVKPQEFTANTEEEKENLIFEGKQQQYKVTVEKI